MSDDGSITDWLAQEKDAVFPDASQQDWQRSRYHRFLNGLAREAAKLPGISEDELVYAHLSSIDRFVYNLGCATGGTGSSPELNVWRHTALDVRAVKSGQQRYIDKHGVEMAAADYLDLSVRTAEVDRCLIDALAFSEFSQFAKEVYTGSGASAFRKGGGPVGWLGWRLASAAFLIGPAIFLSWAFDGQWAGWIAAALIGLFLLETAFSIVMLPANWRAQNKHNAKITSLLQSMHMVYAELDSSGPISAPHIREIAQRATAEGVVWPAVLFVMLDDVIARGGKL